VQYQIQIPARETVQYFHEALEVLVHNADERPARRFRLSPFGRVENYVPACVFVNLDEVLAPHRVKIWWLLAFGGGLVQLV
jgi:hypothetical protein